MNLLKTRFPVPFDFFYPKVLAYPISFLQYKIGKGSDGNTECGF